MAHQLYLSVVTMALRLMVKIGSNWLKSPLPSRLDISKSTVIRNNHLSTLHSKFPGSLYPSSSKSRFLYSLAPQSTSSIFLWAFSGVSCKPKSLLD